MGLVAEGLNDADAAKRLFQADVEIADAGIDRAPGGGHAPAIDDHDGQHRRHDQRHDQRQLRMKPEHQQEGADKGHQRDEGILGAVMGDLADLLQIAGDAGDQLAGPGAVIPAPRQARQVVEGAGAHRGLDIDAQLVAPVDHHRQQARIDRVKHQKSARRRQCQRPVALRQQVVDEGRDRQRKGQFQQARHDRAAEIQPEETQTRAVVGKEAFQYLASQAGMATGRPSGSVRTCIGRP